MRSSHWECLHPRSISSWWTALRSASVTCFAVANGSRSIRSSSAWTSRRLRGCGSGRYAIRALRGRHASCEACARHLPAVWRASIASGTTTGRTSTSSLWQSPSVARFSRATVECFGFAWWSGGTTLRNVKSEHQLVEVVRALQLETMLRPFTRCRECNVLLEVVSREAVDAMLPEQVRCVHTNNSSFAQDVRARVLGGHALQAAETCPRSTHQTRDALGAVRAIARTTSRAECLSRRRRTPDWAE